MTNTPMPTHPLLRQVHCNFNKQRKQPAFFFFYHTKANQAGQYFPTPHAKEKGRREGEKREGGQWGKMGSLTSLQPPLLPAHFQSNSGNKLISVHTIA